MAIRSMAGKNEADQPNIHACRYGKSLVEQSCKWGWCMLAMFRGSGPHRKKKLVLVLCLDRIGGMPTRDITLFYPRSGDQTPLRTHWPIGWRPAGSWYTSWMRTRAISHANNPPVQAMHSTSTTIYPDKIISHRSIGWRKVTPCTDITQQSTRT